MRSLIFSLLLIAVTTVVSAQGITQLEEAKVGFDLRDSDVTRNGDQFTLRLLEKQAGEFEKDPIAYLSSNFDIKGFLQQLKAENYDSVLITFRSTKGYMEADFDKEGNILSTQLRFKNIALPHEIRQELFKSNKGWSMIKNKYVAYGTGDFLEKEVYKIKMQNGNQKRMVKLDPKTVARATVATN